MFQSKSLNKEIHNSIFEKHENEIFHQFVKEVGPKSPPKFQLEAVPEPALSFIFLNLSATSSIPVYFSLNHLNSQVLAKQKSMQKELFLESKKNQTLVKLSENIQKLYEKGSHRLRSTASDRMFNNHSLQYLLGLVKNHFELDGVNTSPKSLERHSEFAVNLAQIHTKNKVDIPFFKLIGTSKDKLSLDEYILKFFRLEPFSEASTQSKRHRVSNVKENKEIDYQFLMITLEYEFNMGNKRSRDLKNIVDQELKKIKNLSALKKIKVYLKFAKYLLDHDVEKLDVIKKVLQKGLQQQKNNYKLNHYMGLVHYKEIQSKMLVKDNKDRAFYELVKDTLKYFIKSIYYNTNLSRKFIIQGSLTRRAPVREAVVHVRGEGPNERGHRPAPERPAHFHLAERHFADHDQAQLEEQNHRHHDALRQGGQGAPAEAGADRLPLDDLPPALLGQQRQEEVQPQEARLEVPQERRPQLQLDDRSLREVHKGAHAGLHRDGGEVEGGAQLHPQVLLERQER